MNAENLEIVNRLEKILEHSETKAESLYKLLQLEFGLIKTQLEEIKDRLKDKG